MEPKDPQAPQDLKNDLYGLEPLDQETELLTFPQKVIGIFTRPKRVFESLRRKPDVLFPYCLSMIVAAVFAFFTMELIRDYTLNTLVETYNRMGMELTAEQLGGFVNTTLVSTVVAMIAASVISPLIKGAFSHLISMAFGTQATLKKSLSVVAYAYLIVILGTSLRIPLALLTENYLFTFSPAYFLTEPDPTSLIYSLLSIFDLFTLWYLVVSVIGFKIVHQLKMGQAAVVVLVPFGLSLLTVVVSGLASANL
jgi:hypothetical protein